MNELEKIFLAFHVNGTYEFALDYVLFRNYKYFTSPIGNRYRIDQYYLRKYYTDISE